MRLLFVLPFLTLELYAQVTLKQLDSYPTSRAKDFYIWQYLKQDISPTNAENAYSKLDKYNSKIFFEYAKKSDNSSVKYSAYCKKLKPNDMMDEQNATCIMNGFSISKFLKLSSDKKKELFKRVKNEKNSSYIELLLDENLSENYRKYEPKDFAKVFTTCTTTFRQNQMNFDIEFDYLNVLSKNYTFKNFVKKSVTNQKMDKINKSLLKIKDNSFSSQTNLFLALNLIKHNKIEKAQKFLDYSIKSAKRKIDVNRAKFWKYQLSKDKNILSELIMSFNIDIYSLYAYEVLHVEPKNYITKIKTSNEKSSLNLTNPFDWAKIRDEIKRAKTKDELVELSKKYDSKNLCVAKALILEKLSEFKEYSYITPYDKFLDKSDDKALIYALMRQESHFIPSALSHSFALGTMQLMPFLVDILNKKLGENMSYTDMFEPKNNIYFAKAHLNWLQSKINSPLFIAYAYNGGYGFTKRHLSTNVFKKGKFEPYMSIEMIANSESREYGKKVVANYVMYKKIFGKDISIIKLFEESMSKKSAHSMF